MEMFNVTLDLTPRQEMSAPDECVPMDTLREAQAALFSMPDAKTDFTDQTFHHFSRGVYGREFRMPAGQTVMSKTHRYSCFFVMLKGEMLIAGNQGKRIVRAGDWFITEAGAKRCAHALTDVVCMTFHGTQETEPEKLEKELIEPEEIAALTNQPCDLLGVF